MTSKQKQNNRYAAAEPGFCGYDTRKILPHGSYANSTSSATAIPKR